MYICMCHLHTYIFKSLFDLANVTKRFIELEKLILFLFCWYFVCLVLNILNTHKFPRKFSHHTWPQICMYVPDRHMDVPMPWMFQCYPLKFSFSEQNFNSKKKNKTKEKINSCWHTRTVLNPNACIFLINQLFA